ncbi:permease [Pseudanabaena sp. PCC 6802]|uniref:permease n=1 Tax=Pseudanabaena sp. PCC 6802 TaxID=118173 RepID=UPI00034DA1A3|nr:permease [Pseudanabaena sp. PCC 6802]
MNKIDSAFTLFLSLLVEAIPFLILGVLLSGLLLIFVDERKLLTMIPKNPLLGSLAGSMVGFLFPVCECGNIPVARRLIVQGVPPAVAIGFLLAAPTINPIVFWATWTAFRDQPEIVFLRVGLSLTIATIVGWIFSAQEDISALLQPSVARSLRFSQKIPQEPALAVAGARVPTGTFILGESQPLQLDTALGSVMPASASDAMSGTKANASKRKYLTHKMRLLIDNTIAEIRELGGVLVVGSAIAAIIQVGIPREIIIGLGQGPVSSIVAMMILAAVVSICSTVDSFFALSFASTFTSGSLLAFLVFGPMIDLKGIGLMLTIFKKRAVMYLFLLAGQLTFLACLFINLHVR